MLIGLTGQIGAGKSTAANILASHGAHIIDADKIGREVVEHTPSLLDALAREFGSKIVTPGGRLSRSRLARIAFAEKESKAVLDKLVHPHLIRELRRQAFSAKRHHSVIVIDAALLLDWGMDREVDHVLVISATRQNRLRRLKRRGMSREDALARQRSQMPLREYCRRADSVVVNNGTIPQLKAKMARLWQRLV